MNLIEMIQETGHLPTSFVLANGRRFETEVSKFKGPQGGFYATIWCMKGTERDHCYTIKYGKTEEEAKQKLIESITKIELL